MSIVGSFEFNRKGSWMIYPSKITVYMHDTIETKGLGKDDVEELAARVQRIVSAPVDAYYASGIDRSLPAAELTSRA